MRLDSDDAGIVSRSPGGLERMMTVIMTACSTFGITASEAKREKCTGREGGGGGDDALGYAVR